MIIGKIGTNQTITYACDELIRILKRMDSTLFLELRLYNEKDISKSDILWIGLDPSVPYNRYDDRIKIDVQNNAGLITGANERAVLMAVYRFVTELGCRFVRPGDDGEHIPAKKVENVTVQVDETPCYRHRCICIEGVNAYEHVYNMINWMPKVGLNEYFCQFFVPVDFFKRWYAHEGNPYATPVEIAIEDVEHIWMQLEQEIAKRGLLLQKVGHGWTCEPLGLPATGWTKQTDLPADVKKYFAQLNGKREAFHDVVLNTQLCYSNPEVQELMANAIVEYAKKNPHVDYISFGLADGSNNYCECENCKDTRPSDYYVDILNLIDEKLTAENVSTRIVFEVYVDLLWAPQKSRIKNPERFVLTFAPITRSFSYPLTQYDHNEPLTTAPYVLNQLELPRAGKDNIGYLKEWQKIYTGEGFIFDYHLMWDHNYDPGNFSCARILHEDMKHIEDLNLHGMVSCQMHRAAYPTGLPVYTMAKTLWNKQVDFNGVAEEYFTADFGEHAEAVKTYLQQLSDLFHLPYLRNDEQEDARVVLADLEKAKEVIKTFFVSHIEKNKDKSSAWKYLYHHAFATPMYADFIALCMHDKFDEALEKLAELKDYMFKNEQDVHLVYDTTRATDIWHWIWRRFKRNSANAATMW